MVAANYIGGWILRLKPICTMEDMQTRWGLLGGIVNTYLMPALGKAWKSVTFKSLRMPKHENIVSKPDGAGSMRYVAYGYLINREYLRAMYRDDFAQPLRDRMIMGYASYRLVYMDFDSLWRSMHSYEGGGSVPLACIQGTFLGEQYDMHNVEESQRSLRCLFSICNVLLQRILDHARFSAVFRMLPMDPLRTSAVLSMVQECGDGYDSFSSLKTYALLLFFNCVVDSFNVDVRVLPYTLRYPSESFIRTLLKFVMDNPTFILDANVVLDSVGDHCVVKLHHKYLNRFIKDQAFAGFMDRHARRFMAGI